MTNKQQTYIQLLSIISASSITVSTLTWDNKTKKYLPTTRENIDKNILHDDRTVCDNEIVFDLDFPSYKKNVEIGNNIIDILTRKNIEFLYCPSGGKGIHIHIFFKPIMFTSEKNKEIFKQAMSYNLSFKHIRLFFWNKVLDEAGVDEVYRGKGKFVDMAPLVFNYYEGTSHLIKDIGGRKIIRDIEGNDKKTYKTYISSDKITTTKPIITNFEEVTFPDIIPTFEMDEFELSEFLTKFVNNCKNNNTIQLKNETLKNGYLSLDGILKLREGLQTGQRSSGASILAVACKIDNIPKQQAYNIMNDYAKKCGQTGHVYSAEEGYKWIDWIYHHENPYWNCSLLDDLGLHDASCCEHCMLSKKDSLKLLKNPQLLEEIKKMLNQTIVGEDINKTLIFLLSLSKDFPSPTGKPGWNIISDPMSQNIIISCESGSGKSWIVKKMLELFGDEDKDFFIVSRITKNAINYYTDVNMDGKIIFIEEIQGMDEHTSQLRVWMSESRLSLKTVDRVKDEDGNEINTLVSKTTKGHPVFITNQAEGIIEDQLNNRSWVLSLDVTNEQTEQILNFEDDMSKNNVKINIEQKRIIVDAIKQLKPYHFIIPYANHKLLNIPIDNIKVRRDYKKFLTLIKCVAYLHQYQREIIKDDENREYIVCNFDDYEIAKQYSSTILDATFTGITQSQLHLLSFLKTVSWRTEFTISDIMRNLGKSQPWWYGQFKQLENIGFITCEKQIGSSSKYTLNEEKFISFISLPSVEELRRLFEVEKSKHTQTEVIPPKQVVPDDTPVTGITVLPKNAKKFLLLDNNKTAGVESGVSMVIPSGPQTGITKGYNHDTQDGLILKTSLSVGVNAGAHHVLRLYPVQTNKKNIVSYNQHGVQPVSVKEQIIKYMLENDNETGVFVQQIIDHFKIKEVEDFLEILKKEGEIYEPKAGYVKMLL